jgi:hypothetical protein
VKAYLNKRPQALDKILNEEEAYLYNENLLGLAKQLRQQLQTHTIRNMTATYMTLPLATIAQEIGLESPEEAAQHVFKYALGTCLDNVCHHLCF